MVTTATLRKLAWGAALALLGAACSQDLQPQGDPAQPPDPGRSWPPDTVLAVEDIPILAAEVDADSIIVQHLEPNATPRALRRKALLNLTLPRVIGLALAGERRAEVRAEAEALREKLVAGLEQGPIGASVRDGGYGSHALSLWGAALETPLLEWTPVVDIGGVFSFARVLERRDHHLAVGVQFRLEIVQLAYIDDPQPHQVIEGAKDQLKLTIIDPAWRLIVPELTQYRMGVHN